MTGALIAPGSEEFARLFHTYRYSAYRLETLQSYASSGEDDVFDAFLAGEPYQRHPGKYVWLDHIARAVAANAWMQRVHVVREPLSDYMRFELTWAYAPNVHAGEDVRILSLAETEPWPLELPTHDYWLFDSAELYRMKYADDRSGSWLGVEHVTDPAEIVPACRARDAAWQRAIRWRDYIDRRPELARLVPAV